MVQTRSNHGPIHSTMPEPVKDCSDKVCPITLETLKIGGIIKINDICFSTSAIRSYVIANLKKDFENYKLFRTGIYDNIEPLKLIKDSTENAQKKDEKMNLLDILITAYKKKVGEEEGRGGGIEEDDDDSDDSDFEPDSDTEGDGVKIFEDIATTKIFKELGFDRYVKTYCIVGVFYKKVPIPDITKNQIYDFFADDLIKTFEEQINEIKVEETSKSLPTISYYYPSKYNFLPKLPANNNKKEIVVIQIDTDDIKKWYRMLLSNTVFVNNNIPNVKSIEAILPLSLFTDEIYNMTDKEGIFYDKCLETYDNIRLGFTNMDPDKLQTHIAELKTHTNPFTYDAGIITIGEGEYKIVLNVPLNSSQFSL